MTIENVYTPVNKQTGRRMRIKDPIFMPGFDHSRGGIGQLKGELKNPRTGKRYKIYGKACSADCACDAWAVEIKGSNK